MSEEDTPSDGRSDGSERTYSRRTTLAAAGGALAGSAVVGAGTAGAASGETLVTPEEPLAATSPGSPVDPSDGFANTQWTAGAELSVVKVTNLNATGEGSFLDAMTKEVSGDGRVVVFEVGGVIDLTGADGEYDPETSNMVVAGQTAPGPGITLIKGSFEIDGENVVVQHIRSRAGTETAPGASGEGDAADSITVADEARNVIVDHCTASWGTDENLSCGDTASTITFSNNMLAHGLAAPGLHPDGEEHSNGTLIGHDTEEMAILGNLYAHNNDRNPRLKGGTRTVVADNVVYNYDTAVRLGDDAESNAGDAFPTQASLAGNVYRAGDNTPLDDPIVDINMEDDVLPVKVSLSDNVIQGPMPLLPSDPDPRLSVVDSPPVWPEGFESTSGAVDWVLNTAGARPEMRVDYDAMVVQQTRERTGRVINRQTAVGGYPAFGPVTHTLNVPTEGFADWFHAQTAAVERPDVEHFQVDFVAGQPIEELGEDGLYAEQDRLMRFAHGTPEAGLTKKGSAWASAEVRNCLDYGHIVTHDGGETAHVHFTVGEGCGERTVSLVVYSMPNGSFSAATADQQELLSATTDSYGPGEHTITVALPTDD